jgi:hypothetical protein
VTTITFFRSIIPAITGETAVAVALRNPVKEDPIAT